MKDINEFIYTNSNKKWIKDVQRYRTEGDWIYLIDKYALAIFRLLRIKHKNIDWLAKEMNLSLNELRSEINGEKEVTLKTLVRIQEKLNTEIISVKNIDLSEKYKSCKIVLYEEEGEKSQLFKHTNIQNLIAEKKNTFCANKIILRSLNVEDKTSSNFNKKNEYKALKI
jgi:hypothetical protein